jgi:hypothetical protein
MWILISFFITLGIVVLSSSVYLNKNGHYNWNDDKKEKFKYRATLLIIDKKFLLWTASLSKRIK